MNNLMLTCALTFLAVVFGMLWRRFKIRQAETRLAEQQREMERERKLAWARQTSSAVRHRTHQASSSMFDEMNLSASGASSTYSGLYGRGFHGDGGTGADGTFG